VTKALSRKFRVTGSGSKPLGLLPDGTPIWPMVGAAKEGDTDDDTGGDDGDDDDDDSGDGDDDDGDDGKGKEKTQAEQDAERVAQARKEAQKHRRALAPWKAIGRDYGLTPDEVRTALDKARSTSSGKGKGDDEAEKVDVAQVQRDADRAATQKANRRIVRAEVKALAAETFADPADAAAFLDLDDIDVDDSGEVDADEIREQLAALLVRKPHLARSGKQRRTPAPDKSQGSTSRQTRDKGKGKQGSVADGAALYRELTGKGKKQTDD